MKFEIKPTRIKNQCEYKTLYIRKDLSREIEKIAYDNDTSWNNVVVSMIEACLNGSNESEE